MSSEADLAQLTAELRAFVAEREWGPFHDAKNLAMLVASEAGELLAELRWVRSEAADAVASADPARGRIADEIGDVGIGLLLLCDRIGLDLVAVMRAKLEKNGVRYPVETSRGRSGRPSLA